MYDELVKDLRENHDKYFARDMQAADAIEELQEKLITTETDLLDLTDALKELSKPKWIPVSERLPEQGKRYLVIRYDYVTKTPFIDILWHDAHDLWWNRLYKGQYNVSYWMPLPEPTKEG